MMFRHVQQMCRPEDALSMRKVSKSDTEGQMERALPHPQRRKAPWGVVVPGAGKTTAVERG